jgi:hypothetical protein
MAATKQTIQDFYRVSSLRDFTRDVQFRILSISPGGTTTTYDESDLVYARSMSLPGRNIGNVPVKYMGLTFNLPGMATYPGSENYEIEFYAEANSALYKKFQQWSRDTFDDKDSTGNYLTPIASSTIDLVQLDNNFEKVNQFQLVGVSIRNLGALAYTPGTEASSGSILSFKVGLAYHYWQEKV